MTWLDDPVVNQMFSGMISYVIWGLRNLQFYAATAAKRPESERAVVFDVIKHLEMAQMKLLSLRR